MEERAVNRSTEWLKRRGTDASQRAIAHQQARLRSERSFKCCLCIVLVTLWGGTQPVYSEAPRAWVDTDGTAHVPQFQIPLSKYMSARAKALYLEQAQTNKLFDVQPGLSIQERRKRVDDFYRPLVERGLARYPVQIEQRTIAGVRTDIVTPKPGVSKSNRDRVLINLHGGGMQVGGGLGGLAESIPIAAVSGITVISVDYRMAPEHKFPAATEDVVAVYKALLRNYKPQNIGIYGCSAGSLLTAQTIVLLQRDRIARPGAIGLFCFGAGYEAGGDSTYTAAVTGSFGKRGPPPAQPQAEESAQDDAYFSDSDISDPMVSPVVSLEALAGFPPTLLIGGNRDQYLSSVLYTHSRLVKAGVEADLHVWEGMWHTFMFEMDMPESAEAYQVVARFFDQHLGTR